MGRIKIYLYALLVALSLTSLAMAKGSGIVTVKVGNGTYASGLEIRKDGKILVSASSFFTNQSRSIIIRRNADGSLDQSFGHDGMVTTSLSNNYIEAENMALHGDGKAVIAGRVIPINEKNQFSGSTNDDFIVT